MTHDTATQVSSSMCRSEGAIARGRGVSSGSNPYLGAQHLPSAMATLLLTEEQKERHLITRLDAAEEMAFRQLTHAKAVLVRAGLSPTDPMLLGAALQAIVANMNIELVAAGASEGPLA